MNGSCALGDLSRVRLDAGLAGQIPRVSENDRSNNYTAACVCLAYLMGRCIPKSCPPAHPAFRDKWCPGSLSQRAASARCGEKERWAVRLTWRFVTNMQELKSVLMCPRPAGGEARVQLALMTKVPPELDLGAISPVRDLAPVYIKRCNYALIAALISSYECQGEMREMHSARVRHILSA